MAQQFGFRIFMLTGQHDPTVALRFEDSIVFVNSKNWSKKCFHHSRHTFVHSFTLILITFYPKPLSRLLDACIAQQRAHVRVPVLAHFRVQCNCETAASANCQGRCGKPFLGNCLCLPPLRLAFTTVHVTYRYIDSTCRAHVDGVAMILLWDVHFVWSQWPKDTFLSILL